MKNKQYKHLNSNVANIAKWCNLPWLGFVTFKKLVCVNLHETCSDLCWTVESSSGETVSSEISVCTSISNKFSSYVYQYRLYASISLPATEFVPSLRPRGKTCYNVALVGRGNNWTGSETKTPAQPVTLQMWTTSVTFSQASRGRVESGALRYHVNFVEMLI